MSCTNHYFHQTCTHDEFCVTVTLKHTHNHLVDVADALRFRPVSESTKEKYYDLFRQGHSPSSAHLEYETQLTYKDTQLLADRHVNPLVMYTTCLTSGGNLIWVSKQGNSCLQNLNKELKSIMTPVII